MNNTISAIEDSCSREASHSNIIETTPSNDWKAKCVSSQKNTAYFMKKAVYPPKISQSTRHNAWSLQQDKSENSISEDVSKHTNSKKKPLEWSSKLSKWEDFLMNKLKLSMHSPEIDTNVPIYSLTVRQNLDKLKQGKIRMHDRGVWKSFNPIFEEVSIDIQKDGP